MNETQLIRTHRKGYKKQIEIDDRETIPKEEKVELNDVLHATKFDINSDEKVELWLKENQNWQKQPIWKPSEHPLDQKHDTFIHINPCF